MKTCCVSSGHRVLAVECQTRIRKNANAQTREFLNPTTPAGSRQRSRSFREAAKIAALHNIRNRKTSRDSQDNQFKCDRSPNSCVKFSCVNFGMLHTVAYFCSRDGTACVRGQTRRDVNCVLWKTQRASTSGALGKNYIRFAVGETPYLRKLSRLGVWHT